MLLGAGPARADIVRDTEAWVLSAMSLPSAWQVSQGQGVLVAVIDSGVNPERLGSGRQRHDLVLTSLASTLRRPTPTGVCTVPGWPP